MPVPPPTALTPEEQETYRQAKNKAVTNVDYGILAIITRLDAQVAELKRPDGWVNLADPAVCHGGHAACVHVVTDMRDLRDGRDALVRALEEQRALWTLAAEQLNATDDAALHVRFMDLHKPIHASDTALAQAHQRGKQTG